LQEVTATSMQWNPSLQNPHGLTMMKALPLSFAIVLEIIMGLGLKIILVPIFIFFAWSQMLSI
jgi:hypothetical protein